MKHGKSVEYYVMCKFNKEHVNFSKLTLKDILSSIVNSRLGRDCYQTVSKVFIPLT